MKEDNLGTRKRQQREKKKQRYIVQLLNTVVAMDKIDELNRSMREKQEFHHSTPVRSPRYASTGHSPAESVVQQPDFLIQNICASAIGALPSHRP